MTSSERNPAGSGRAALRWWSALQPRRPDGTRNPARNTAALAELRRASVPIDAIENDAAIDLYDRLFPGGRSSQFDRLLRVGTLACVLAHVRQHEERSRAGEWLTVARAVGLQDLSNPTSAPMSPLRFRRLLAARGEDEVLTCFRRLVALAGHTVNIVDLAESILDWADDEAGDRRRVRWAFDYHGARRARPGAPAMNSPLAASEPTP